MAKEIKTVFTAQTSSMTAGFAKMKSGAESFKSVMLGLGVVGSAAGLVEAVKKMAEYSEEVEKLSKRIGSTVQGAQGLIKFGKAFDMTMEETSNALFVMNKNLGDTTDIAPAAASALSTLGLSAKQLSGLKPEERYYKIALALSKIQDAGKRAKLGTDIFAKGFKGGLENLVSGGADEVQKAMEKALTVPKISDKTIATFAELEDTMRKLGGMQFSAGMKVAGPAVESLVGGLKEAQSILERMHKDGTFERIGEELGKIAEKALHVFKSVSSYFKQKSLWHILLDLTVLRMIMKTASGIIAASFADAYHKSMLASAAAAAVAPAAKTSAPAAKMVKGYGDINSMLGAKPVVVPVTVDTVPAMGKIEAFASATTRRMAMMGAAIKASLSATWSILYATLSNPMMFASLIYMTKQWADYFKGRVKELQAEIDQMSYQALRDQNDMYDAIITGANKRYDAEKARLDELEQQQGSVLDSALKKIEKQAGMVGKLKDEYDELGKKIEDYRSKLEDVNKDIKEREQALADLKSKHSRDEADAIRKNAETMRTAFGKSKDVLEDLDDVSTDMLEKLASGSVDAFAQLTQMGRQKGYADEQKHALKEVMSGKSMGGNMAQNAAWFAPLFRSVLPARKEMERADKKEFGRVAKNNDQREMWRSGMNDLESQRKQAQDEKKQSDELAAKKKEAIALEKEYHDAINKHAEDLIVLTIAQNKLNQILAEADKYTGTNEEMAERVKSVRRAMMDSESGMASDLQEFADNLDAIAKDIETSSTAIAAQRAKTESAKRERDRTAEVIGKEKAAKLESEKEGYAKEIGMMGLKPEDIKTGEQMQDVLEKAQKIKSMEKKTPTPTGRMKSETKANPYVPMGYTIAKEKVPETVMGYSPEQIAEQEKLKREAREKIAKENIESAAPASAPQMVTPAEQVVNYAEKRQRENRPYSAIGLPKGEKMAPPAPTAQETKKNEPPEPTRGIVKPLPVYVGEKETLREKETNNTSKEIAVPVPVKDREKETLREVHREKQLEPPAAPAQKPPSVEVSPSPVILPEPKESKAEWKPLPMFVGDKPQDYGRSTEAVKATKTATVPSVDMSETNGLLREVVKALNQTTIIPTYGGSLR